MWICFSFLCFQCALKMFNAAIKQLTIPRILINAGLRSGQSIFQAGRKGICEILRLLISGYPFHYSDSGFVFCCHQYTYHSHHHRWVHCDHQLRFQSCGAFHYRADFMEKHGNLRNDVEKRITHVLFCGPHFPASHEYTAEYLQNHSSIKVDVLPLEDVPKAIANYHVCIVKNMRLDSDIISRAVQMQLIMQYGVGLEGVDIDAATKHGIKVARIPSDVTGNSTSCAEMAIYLMLGLLRKQNELQISIQQKKLGYPITETLFGKTIFILGFGNIGLDLAKRLQPFGVKIIATKRSWASYEQNTCKLSRSDVDDLVDLKGNNEDIYNFARKADIVVCCLTLNSETTGIIDNKFISSMKKGALLVNVARGGLVDYAAVLSHLKSGHLGGLGSDVAWTEPFDPDDQILKLKNVIITPHVAGVTEHSYRSMAKVVGDVVLQLHAGLPLTGIELVN